VHRQRAEVVGPDDGHHDGGDAGVGDGVDESAGEALTLLLVAAQRHDLLELVDHHDHARAAAPPERRVEHGTQLVGLAVEASRQFREGTAQNYLRDEDVTTIAATVHAFKEVPKYARVVGLDEIDKNDWNLNIPRYVETADAAEKVDVASAIAELRELERKRGEMEAQMNSYLKELGYDA
jgi:hypothetical protein